MNEMKDKVTAHHHLRTDTRLCGTSSVLREHLQQPGAHPSPASAPLLRLWAAAHILSERERRRRKRANRSDLGVKFSQLLRTETFPSFPIYSELFLLRTMMVFAAKVRKRLSWSSFRLKWKCAWGEVTCWFRTEFIGTLIKSLKSYSLCRGVIGGVWLRDVNPVPSCWTGGEEVLLVKLWMNWN